MNGMKRNHAGRIAAWLGLPVLLISGVLYGQGGEMKWMRVGSLRSNFSEQAAQVENAIASAPTICYGLAWPAEYGMAQSSLAQNAVWMLCKDFFDPVRQRTYPAKAVGTGYRAITDWPNQMFPVSHRLIARFPAPAVSVDNESASENETWDVVDEIDDSMPADRMIVTKLHSSMGITMTKRIMAFTQQNHDNYYVIEYVFKNTGIINAQGGTHSQTLQDCYFFMSHRYAFSGESVTGYNQGWGTWESTWGRNTISDVMGTDPNAGDTEGIRAVFAWYGPQSTRTVSDDWGCPNEQADPTDNVPDEILAAARYAGIMTLHADRSASDKSDDPFQPVTTAFTGSDDPVYAATVTQYDEAMMQRKYNLAKAGHAAKSHAEEVGDGFANTWGSDGGGYAPCTSYGPYTLAPGDSVRIIQAEAVAGLSRAKNREVARNWILWDKAAADKPALVRPNGQATTDHGLYKREWVWTCKDSLMQSFRRAKAAYESDFGFPQPPPPPETFTVSSGGDRIMLTWAPNAESDPNFDGYEIWRAKGIVDQPNAVYEKIWECGGNGAPTRYDDMTAQRGVDYYYYIVSKDDGSRNDAHPGTPLVSSKFYTMTNKPAYLRRPAGTSLDSIRVVPNPYVISKQALQFGIQSGYDRIAFFGLPPFCKIKIFTERGDLIKEFEHENGTGDEKWESVTSSNQIIVTGLYVAYFEVTQDYHNSEGVLLFKKGQNTYRKFIVIR